METMKAVVQRVSRAAVSLPDGTRREIGRGIVVLLGVGPEDNEAQAAKLAEKLSNLRLFPDEQGKFDRSVLDIKGEALVVSQFTLFGDCSKGRRPDFTAAAKPEQAEPLYRFFSKALESTGVPVKTGEFGASMQVELVNEGPVTLVLGWNS